MLGVAPRSLATPRYKGQARRLPLAPSTVHCADGPQRGQRGESFLQVQRRSRELGAGAVLTATALGQGKGLQSSQQHPLPWG